MTQENFLPRCHPHMLGEDGQVELAQCEALAADMADLREMGIILTLVGNYAVGPYRYSNLGDALAQARKAQSDGKTDATTTPPMIIGH